MSHYTIIDEPRPGAKQALIMNPMVILLAAIFVPLFWSPPLFGRFWMPLLWLGLNGVFLGSPTLKKELAILVGVLLSLPALFYGVLFVVQQPFWPFAMESAYPYLRISLQGALFIGLYWVTILQTAPYEIFQYARELRTS